MQALLDAIGSFGKLGAEAMTANEERRAAIRTEAQSVYRTYMESLENYWGSVSATDAEMAALARPLPKPAPSPAAPSSPPTPPAPAPIPAAPAPPPAVETPPVTGPQPTGEQ